MSTRTRAVRRRPLAWTGGLAALAALALASGVVPSCAGAAAPDGPLGGGGEDAASCPADCSADPSAPLCDPETGSCVACLPGAAACPTGHRCAPDTKRCVPGCESRSDCPAPLTCDLEEHACVGCAASDECPPGQLCSEEGECVQGCSAARPCPGGAACCGGVCRDLETDARSCGVCDRACPDLAHAESACLSGACGLSACDSGFIDCNRDPADGCEHDVAARGPCSCTPGETRACYQGPPGTEGVSPCAPGVSTCRASGLAWGPCLDQVLPELDACGDGIDNDCDGVVDNTPDQDGDGWTICEGDCCDSASDGCSAPAFVNRGAFEVPDNGVDDDCDGAVDNTSPCDAGLASDSTSALNYAKAMDLCVTTTATPPSPSDRTWGVVSATFQRADGTGAPAVAQRSIRQGFGSGISPLRGARLAVLSTGVAAAQAAPNNTRPSFAAFQGGRDMGTSSGMPADWLDANGENLPNAPGCPEPQGGTTAHDPVMLRLRVRVPTNASSFSVSTFFLSSEYPEWVCSRFNDFFLALLDSRFEPFPGETPNPADKNLAFYDPPPAGAPVYPLGVNLAFGGTGLFTQCVSGPTGCGGGATPGTTSTCAGTDQLRGTGFDAARPPAQFDGEPGWCGASELAGGGTGWLVMHGNVSPGEIMELRFVLWDTGDPWNDSVALLDNFQWSSFASTPGTRN
ncbi:MopE-related protein [Sorangium sp. So ce1153]|uniref:MopE-related protein n=1 Tax=Sorangium sp. So ce1153 TaxID=3133333 RepID=UPI003F5F837A